MSPDLFGVETNGGTRFSTLEYNGLNVTDSTIPSTMNVASTGITFPDTSFQETAFPPTGGTDAQYIKGDGTLGTLPSGGGVPYTGATADVDLGTYSISAKGANFLPTTPPTYTEGKVWYDSAQKSLAFYNDASYAPVYIGENIVLKVYNNTGSTISKGAPVYIQSGGSFTYPNVALAKADSAATAAVIGLMNGYTPTGSIGYVTSAGVITGVNTGGMTEGTILYLSPYSAGQLMNTVPPTGFAIQVGVVAHQNTPNGTIYTKQTTPLAISAATIVVGLTVAQGGTGVTSITASRALTSDATGKVVASSVTSTELDYVSGVTSSIQTQLNSKIGNSVSTFGFQLANTIALSATTWVGVGLNNGSNESTSTYIMPMACTLSDMYTMHYTTTQPASGSQVFTVRKNGVDTALSITIAAGSAPTTTPYSNTANSVTFAVGDKLSIRRVNNATAIGGAVNGLSFKMVI
jgi:hypothetical protein